MTITRPQPRVQSLTEWSKAHIQAVFEADTDDESIQAMQETFSQDLRAEVNGVEVGYPQVKAQVLALRKGNKLQVTWKGLVESASNDASTLVRPQPSPSVA